MIPEPPVINGLRVDPVIFTQGFVDRCDIVRCGGECCASGVWADVDERARILAHAPMIEGAMDATQPHDPAAWFGTEEIDDADFPSGRAVGTEVYHGKCAFQMHDGRCVLQVAAAEQGMHPWALKPRYCVMFPLVVAEGVLSYDDEHAADMHYCGLHCPIHHTRTVFEACGPEIAYALGEDGYAQLRAFYDAHRAAFERQAPSTAAAQVPDR